MLRRNLTERYLRWLRSWPLPARLAVGAWLFASIPLTLLVPSLARLPLWLAALLVLPLEILAVAFIADILLMPIRFWMKVFSTVGRSMTGTSDNEA